MTPLRTVNLLRALFVVFTICVGSTIGIEIFASAPVGAGLGAIFGLAIVLIDRLLDGISLRVFSSATFGLFVGFIFSRLLLSSRLLAGLSGQAQWIAGLIIYSAFGYLGMMLAIRSNRDELSLIIPYVRFRRATVQDAPLVIDANVILDGRVADLCATGFLSSSLVVPRSAVENLQALADSTDPLKRERGRAALDRLQQMQRNPDLGVRVHESDDDPGIPADTQLIKLALLLDARLLTTDASLSSLARLQGVPALNLSDLTRAMRPTLGAGEEAELSLVKEGRETHQAVGYLADGTMVVVNHARAHLGRTMKVIIGSSLQTSAGRMLFAELKEAA